jgi:hypothetical protein
MWRHSKTIKLLLIIFVGWFIGAPGYFGYAILNDADFLATLPQFENPDLDGLSAVWKSPFFSTFPAVPNSSYLQANGLSSRSFTGTRSSENLDPVLRC